MNATCLDENGNSVHYLTQWDSGQKLIIEDNYTLNSGSKKAPLVQFCNINSVEALGVQSSIVDGKIIADIPNSLLREPYAITAYIFFGTSESGKVVETVSIPIHKRVKPTDYEYSDNVQVIYLRDVLATVEQLRTDTTELYITTKSYVFGDTGTRAGEEQDNAKYYYEQSKVQATNSANSANASKSSENAAALSEKNTKTSETNAMESLKAAAASESNAKQSEENAKLSESNAKNSATSAAASESNAKTYADKASGYATDSANSASQAKGYVEDVQSEKEEISNIIKNSLLESSDEILNNVEDFYKRAEALYRSCNIVCDGETPARRARTIVEIDCHTPQRRATGYSGIDFDGGTPAIRLLGE